MNNIIIIHNKKIIGQLDVDRDVVELALPVAVGSVHK